ncbi:MAG: ZIP family metal transporter, partial [Patescibacteria group bacterium]|nr:ZIP family metal transporter [Patescibacteria group bacterium]
AVADSFAGKASMESGLALLITLFAGIALGLIGLAFYERRFMKPVAKTEARLESSMASKEEPHIDRYKLAMMIAIGIGAHNFSEGLAIGQSYAAGVIGLALLLIIGFGAHNATEGFGILGPIAGGDKKPSWKYLLKLGLVGGGPTFLGTLIGSLWISPILYVLFLAFAGGALIFVILLMHSVVTKQIPNTVLMSALFAGLLLGFATDLIVSLAGA